MSQEGAIKQAERGGIVGNIESVKTTIILKPRKYKRINKKIEKTAKRFSSFIGLVQALRQLRLYGHNLECFVS